MSEELDLLAGDKRPIRYVEVDDDGTERVIYRASSIGACERALVATARKVMAQPHPAWFQEVLDEGSRYESVIDQAWINETEIFTVDHQREFNLYIGEIDDRQVYVRSHVDGISERDESTIREYKKFRDSTWPEFLSKGVEIHANYPWQVSIAMHALDAELLESNTNNFPSAVEFVGGHLVDGEITEVYATYIAHCPIPLLAIRKKVARIERLINQGFDVMEVPCQLNYPCPYYRYHDPVEARPVVEVADPQVEKMAGELSGAQVAAGQVRKTLEALDNKVKAKREELLTAIRAAGGAPNCDAHAGDLVIKWTEFDKKAYEVKARTETRVTVTSKEPA